MACNPGSILPAPAVMSRVEELPNDSKQSLNLNTPPLSIHEPASATDTFLTASTDSAPFPIDASRLEQDGTTPALPPHMASVRSHTADEIVQMMNRTPLFMTSLESTEGDGMWQAAVFGRTHVHI